MALTDIFVYGFLLLFFAFEIFTAFTIFTEMNARTGIINQTYISPSGATSFNPYDTGYRYLKMFDWGFLLILLGLTLGMFYAGYILPSNPVFTAIGLVVVILWLLISPYLANTFYSLIHYTILGNVADELPLTYTIITNLPIIGLVVGVISNIIMYGKGGGATGGYGS